MKKIGLILVTLLASLVLTTEVSAASATVKVGINNPKIVVGSSVRATVTISSASPLGSWEYSLNYDKSKLSLVKSDVDLHYVYVAQNNNTKTVSYSYTFKAIKNGTAEFYLTSTSVIGWDENDMTVTKKNNSVNIITQAELEASYSKDNYLKELTVEGQTLTPEFNKETLVYNVTLEPLTASIIVSAKKNDSRSAVEGDGERTLTVGLNKIDIVVTSQSGNKRTYTINANVKELKPINVTINNENYTVLRNLSEINKLAIFTETTILIDGEEVPALYNELTKYTLVGLTNSNNESKFYLYNQEKNEYLPFNTINVSGLVIQILEPKSILKPYKKFTETINDLKVSSLKLNSKSNFSIIYGLDLETNKENYYSFDHEELTMQKYNKEAIDLLLADNQEYLLLTLLFSGISVILLALILTKAIKKKPKKEKIKEPKEEKIIAKKTKNKNDDLKKWFNE